MNFSNILTATRNAVGFSFFGANRGNNALATVKDLGNITTQLNNMFPYRFFDVSLNQVLAEAPVVSRLAAGAGECSHNCTCSTSAGCCCDCKATCTNEDVGIALTDAIMGSSRVGVGSYVFTFNMPPDYIARYPRAAKIANVGFNFTPFSLPTHSVTVEKLPVPDGNQYAVKTYDAGVLADNILHDTVVAMKIYFQ